MTDYNAIVLGFDSKDDSQVALSKNHGCLTDFCKRATMLHEVTIKTVRTNLDTIKTISLSNRKMEISASIRKTEESRLDFGKTNTESMLSPKDNERRQTIGSDFRLTTTSAPKNAATFGNTRNKIKEPYKQTPYKSTQTIKSSKNLFDAVTGYQNKSYNKNQITDIPSELSNDLLKSHPLDPSLFQTEEVYSRRLGERTSFSYRADEETIMNNIAESLLKQPDSGLYSRQDVGKVPSQLFMDSGLNQRDIYMGLMMEGKMKETNIEILRRGLADNLDASKVEQNVGLGHIRSWSLR